MNGSPDNRRGLSTTLAVAILVLAGLAAYSNSFSGAFVYDDNDSIVPNPAIRHLWPPWAFLHAGGRPLVMLSFAVDYAVGGVNVAPYHAFNLAIHLLAALTLFGIVRRTLALPSVGDSAIRNPQTAFGLALSIALLWVVHPLQTESVTYVVQRAESLAGLFYLLTLYCFIRAVSSADSGRSNHKDTKTPRKGNFVSVLGVLVSWWSGWRWYLGAGLACALGAGCKETIVTAPVIVLLYDRAFLGGSFREAFRRRWALYLALAATWLLVFPGVVVMAVSDRSASAGFQLPITPAAYALTQLGVILYYLRLAFWPHPLCLDYGWPVAATAAQVLPGAVVIGGLLAGTAALLALRPKWGFLGAWFFLILAPTSSIMPIADVAVEHRMYLPLVAVIAAVVIGGWALARRLAREQVAAALVLLVAAALAALTFARNKDYSSEARIWEDTITHRPDDPRAYNARGQMRFQDGDYEEAILDFGIAIEKGPSYAAAYQNRAAAEIRVGRYDAAIHDCDAAIRLHRDFALAFNTRAVAFARRGGQDVARRDFEQARRDYDAAFAAFDRAIELNPSFSEACFNRGSASLATGNYDNAIADYDRAIALEYMPDCAPVYTARGNAYARKGDYDQALRDFTRAIQIRPGYLDAFKNRAVAYFRKQEYHNAWADIETLLRLGGQPYPGFLDELRAASPEPQ